MSVSHSLTSGWWPHPPILLMWQLWCHSYIAIWPERRVSPPASFRKIPDFLRGEGGSWSLDESSDQLLWPDEWAVVTVKLGSHVHPCGPRGTVQGAWISGPEPYGGRKKRFPQGRRLCPQKRGRRCWADRSNRVYLGVLGAEWNALQIYASHSYPFSLMLRPLQQVSDYTALVLQRELL